MNNLNPVYLILEAQNPASKRIGKELGKFIARNREVSRCSRAVGDAMLNAKTYTKAGGAVSKAMGYTTKGTQAAVDAVASATKGANLLTKGQKAVGKGRKTFKGKIKQHMDNAKTVYNKIHS